MMTLTNRQQQIKAGIEESFQGTGQPLAFYERKDAFIIWHKHECCPLREFSKEDLFSESGRMIREWLIEQGAEQVQTDADLNPYREAYTSN